MKKLFIILWLSVLSVAAQQQVLKVVNTLSELKTINPDDVNKSVMVLSSGITYVWNSSSITIADDDQVVATPRKASGRWLALSSQGTQATPTIQFKTVADMIAFPIPSSNSKLTALVSGRLVENDGYGGEFYFQSSASMSTNRGLYHGATGNNGRWIRRNRAPLNVGWFAADPTGVVASTAAFKDAINAAAYTESVEANRLLGSTIEVPPGLYLIDDTIGITNVFQLCVRGLHGSVTLLWNGANDRPMFNIQNGYQCALRDIRIHANTSKPLLIGIQQYTKLNDGPNYYTPGSSMQYDNVTIEGNAAGALAHGWRLGGIAGGLIGVLGDDIQNDFTTWVNCSVLNQTGAGWDVEGANCFNNLWLNSRSIGLGGASYGVYVNRANGHWIGGGLYDHAEDFHMVNESEGVWKISGLDSEGSGRLWNGGGFSAARQQLSIDAVRFTTLGLNADGKVLITSKSGSLSVRDSFFGCVNCTANVKFDVSPGFFQLASFSASGNTIFCDAASPWVTQTPSVSFNNIQVSNSVYIPLPNVLSGVQTISGTVTAAGGFRASNVTSLGGTLAYTGVPGVTTWGYKVTVVTDTGESLPSAQVTIANCAATLDGTHYVTIEILTGNSVPGAKSYRIYRTLAGTSPATTGLIGEISTTTYGSFLQLNDTGLAVGAAPPTVDTSGDTQFITSNATTFKSGIGGYATPGNIDGTGSSAYFPVGLYVPPTATAAYLFAPNTFITGNLLDIAGNWTVLSGGDARFKSLKVSLASVPIFANNAAALAGGFVAGQEYRTGGDPDILCIVH